MEQIRIVKEMRAEDERNGRAGVDIRPRYMVWENVPGAFSSNKGEDFRIVLEELAKVADKDAVIPRPADGKWRTSGCIMGRGWSIAWRVLDAQFWGTSDKPLPQRRRRIALVADFGGESAPTVLFVSKGVSGDLEPGEPKRKETPSDATRGVGADDSLGADQYNAVILGGTVSTLGVNCGMSHGRQCVLEPLSFLGQAGAKASSLGVGKNVSAALTSNQTINVCVPTAYGISSYDSNAMKSSNPDSGIYEAETSRTLDGNGGNPACNQGGIAVVEPIPYTLKIRSGVSVDSQGKAAGKGALIQTDLSATLGVSQDQYLFQPVYSVENHPNDSRVGINEDGKVQALTSRMGTGGGNVPMVMQCYSKSKRAQTATDNETWVESETANTLNSFDVGDVRTTEAVVMEAYQHHGYRESDVCGTLTAGQNNGVRGDTPLVCYSVDQGGGKSSVDVREGKAPTLTTTHDGAPAVCYWDGGQLAGTLTANNAGGSQRMPDKENFNCVIQGINGDKAGTLDSSYFKGCGMRAGVEREVVAVDCRNATEDSVNGALQSNSAHSLNGNNVVRTRYIVRRLTPLECERLQGYPDGWTDIGEYIDSTGKKRQTSDAARYKALGNSIALPPWKWVLKRLCACYERDATMASLFDGIGGFPYLWEQLNGKGSCLWASEIEEFPMAVTKVRIGE